MRGVLARFLVEDDCAPTTRNAKVGLVEAPRVRRRAKHEDRDLPQRQRVRAIRHLRQRVAQTTIELWSAAQHETACVGPCVCNAYGVGTWLADIMNNEYRRES